MQNKPNPFAHPAGDVLFTCFCHLWTLTLPCLDEGIALAGRRGGLGWTEVKLTLRKECRNQIRIALQKTKFCQICKCL